MKKLILPLFLAILAFSACEKKTSDSGNDIDSTAVEDDAAAKAAREQAIADSLAKDSIMKDSIMKASIEFNNFHTADLNAFLLHGHAKQLVEQYNYGRRSMKIVVSFDKSGGITSFVCNGNNMPIHKSNGHIVSAGGNGEWKFSFKNNSQLTGKHLYMCPEDLYPDYSYRKYNADGLPVSGTVTVAPGGDGYSEGAVSYSYSAYDECHNFTKCIETIVNKSYIWDCMADNYVAKNETEKNTITRTITYYSSEELK